MTTPAILERILRKGTAGEYKVALYSGVVTRLAYSLEGEVRGEGYYAGGLALSAPTYGHDGGSAWMRFTGSVVWRNSTIKAKSAMVYNAQTLDALLLVDFGAEISSTNDKFRVDMPDNPVITWKI
jgi:hypothetical protein